MPLDHAMDARRHSLLIWFVRVTTTLLVVVTLLPLWQVGLWYVRLWDFPRLQIAVLTVVPLLAVATAFRRRRGRRERRELAFWAGTALIVAIWQLAQVAPFTPVWAPELADAAVAEGVARVADEPVLLRVFVANIRVDNPRHDDVAAAVLEQDPDIALLVEVDEAWAQSLRVLDKKLPHQVIVARDGGFGMGLWSRLPVLESDVRCLVSPHRPAIFARLALGEGRTARFVGVHPAPPGVEDESEHERQDSRERDAELVLVARHVQRDPEATWMVTGDFNDVAWSHTTRLFKELSGLLDPRVGRALLNTYHADYPLLRYPIDHVFFSTGARLAALDRVDIPGSDHFGIFADVLFPAAVQGAGPGGAEQSAEAGDMREAGELVAEGRADAAPAAADWRCDPPR